MKSEFSLVEAQKKKKIEGKQKNVNENVGKFDVGVECVCLVFLWSSFPAAGCWLPATNIGKFL